jgi:carboxyl-terminal processing protease
MEKGFLKKVRGVVYVLILMVLVGGLSFSWGKKKSFPTQISGGDLDLSLMWLVKSRLEESFLEAEQIDEEKMIYGAISGLVSSLGDPYTVFLPPEEQKRSEEDLNGEFGGVGIQLGYKENVLAVMSPLPGTPADRAGLRAGDMILRIVDEKNEVDRDTMGISLLEAVRLIRGEQGTVVSLKIYRKSEDKSFEVDLTRGVIVVPSVELEWKEVGGKQVAWLKLYRFTERLFEEWPQTVDEIKNKERLGNFGGIVLDLRDNPGGFLQGAVLVASDFLKEGLVVSQESRRGIDEKYQVDKTRGALLNEKMMILMNGGSASAAEILGGALKEYERGMVVGEKTFGKGTVQQPEDLPGGSGLHITVARWLLPNGENIHGVGVEADVVVEDLPEEEGDEQLEKAINILLEGQ